MLLTACGWIQNEDERARQDFIQRFRFAHETHDLEKLMDLFCWDAVEANYRRLVRLGLQTEVQYDLLNIEIVELEPGEHYDYYHVANKAYGPNLEPMCKVSVQYDVPERLHSTFMLGKRDGEYWIINPKVIENADGATP